MTDPGLCKKGLHERNDENNRQRTVNSGGKVRVINECLACAREAKERKALARKGKAA